MKIKLTADRLRDLLSYDQETGVFRWNECRGGLKVGSVAGTGDGKGYLQVRVDGVKYRSHRLAWMYVYGEWPAFEIDHINQVKDDNRILNLRPSDRVHNLQNQSRALKNNKSGLLGVGVDKSGRYSARIKVNGVSVFLGLHDSPEMAHTAYMSAKRKYHQGAHV